MKLNLTKTSKVLQFSAFALIVTMFSCDSNFQETTFHDQSHSIYRIDEALTNVKVTENGLNANVNTDLIRKIALKEYGANEISSQDLYFYKSNKLRKFVEENNANHSNSSRAIPRIKKIRIIDGGGTGGSTLTVYSTSATVYGPDFSKVEDYRFTYDKDDIIQSTAKKYTGKDFIGDGNYGTESIVSEYQVYPDGTYVNGSGIFLCYNYWHRSNLPNGSISCDDEVILKAKATLGNNYPGMTSCTARIYCDD